MKSVCGDALLSVTTVLDGNANELPREVQVELILVSCKQFVG